ncbi:MAG TPA: SRPBCC family protein [Pseudonocardiaceae bacterium]|jgi:uncharacterized protein YndB with AHSA1/START domain|nr:SRPBCC family protein [Pseudonocardiaceae bacterium]
MNDILDQFTKVHREVGTTGGHSVLLSREYDGAIEDVWDACTDPERIGRWFLPVTGDLRPGGTYQLEGNAGGEIVRCEPPRLVKVTWVFGGQPPSEVEVRLSPGADGRTRFELEHTVLADETMWTEFGPGAVGVGWDLVLLGLSRHLQDPTANPPEEWSRSAEAREYLTRCGTAWGEAHEASGAGWSAAQSAAASTIAFYAPSQQTEA